MFGLQSPSFYCVSAITEVQQSYGLCKLRFVQVTELRFVHPLWFWGIRIQPTFALVRVVLWLAEF